MKKAETASQRAERLMQEVGDGAQATYSKGEVRTILNAIAACNDASASGFASVENLRRGDVFVAAVTGGKVRPWIVLRVTGNLVVAVSMSSGDSAPRMVKSQCRLWANSWIGTTVSLFDRDYIAESVTRPYTNSKHLREIESGLAGHYGLRPIKRRRK